MFFPSKMSKIRVIFIKPIMEGLLRDLQEMGVVHLEEVRDSEGFFSSEAGRSRESLSSMKLKLSSLISFLEPYVLNSRKRATSHIGLEEVNPLLERVSSFVSELKEIDLELSELERKSSLAKSLSYFSDDLSELTSRSTDLKFYLVPKDKSSKFSSLCSELGCACDFRPYSKDKVLFAVIGKKGSGFSGRLEDFGALPVDVSSDMLSPGKFLEYSRKRVFDLKKRRLEIQSDLSKEADKLPSLRKLLVDVENALEREKAVSSFAFSDKVGVLEGWVEQDRLPELQRELYKKFGSKVAIENLGDSEGAPVKLRFSGVFDPIRTFVEMFSLPSYGTLDPTPVYFVVFPFLYGMIVGDAVYGLMSIILSFFIIKSTKDGSLLNSTAKAWLIGGFSSILFGIAFDEWMGTSHFELAKYLEELGFPIHLDGPLYHGFSRIHNFALLLVSNLLVGSAILGLGFILGAVNEWKHNKKHAAAKVFWLTTEIFMVLSVASGFFGVVDSSLLPAFLAGLLISVAGLYFTEGVIGIIEIPGLVGNIFSFIRIAAVGIAGVVLAEIINSFLLYKHPSPLIAAFSFVALLVLHFINSFIAMFEALIQGGRLNIVEFQSKFLIRGNKPFSPFSIKKQKGG